MKSINKKKTAQTETVRLDPAGDTSTKLISVPLFDVFPDI